MPAILAFIGFSKHTVKIEMFVQYYLFVSFALDSFAAKIQTPKYIYFAWLYVCVYGIEV